MGKQTVYSDKYLDAFYDQDFKLIEHYWKKESENITEAEYQTIHTNVVATILDNGWKGKKALLDNRDFLFTITPELQEWQAKHIFPKAIKQGLEKVAIIMSQELFSQMSIEQTIEEHEEIEVITCYFDDISKAKEWLGIA